VLVDTSPTLLLRLFRALFILTVDKAACLANQLLLTLRTGNRHIGLIDGNMDVATPWLERPSASFTDEWLFAKTALDHGGFRSPPLSPERPKDAYDTPRFT
jgi:hypothetical protein